VAHLRRSFPPLQGSASTDLAIVGGGFLGLWTAISGQGAQSVPLCHPAGRPAGGLGCFRSQRRLCEASITHGEENGQQRWPEEMPQLEAQGLQNLDEIEATIRRYGIDCDFERTGVLLVAVEPYQDEQLRGEGYMDATQIRAELNSPTFLSGIWEKDSTR
jgi:glycine/D-amino acid oxidase-like deaminating enzyme